MNGRIERKFEKRSMKDYNKSYVNIRSEDLDLLNKKQSKVADKCIKYLEMIGVEYVFGIQSGSNLPLYDSICKSNIKTIINKNEAGSAYSASQYAGASDKLGVSILGGSVGVNNAINGIADAYVNKYPVLIISGSPSRLRKVRGGIQNVDAVSITKPITKYSYLVECEDEVLAEIHKAVCLAITPPFGPVHLSIPVDIQSTVFSGTSKKWFDIEINEPKYDINGLEEAINVIDSEEKGIIYAGKGAKRFSTAIKEISKKLNWPIISTPCGKGVVEDDFELYMGNYGMCSCEFAKSFVSGYDYSCVLIVGTSLKEVSITDYDDVILKGKKIIHIDNDKEELNKVFEVDNAVYFDLRFALPYIYNRCNVKKKFQFKKDNFNTNSVENYEGVSVRYFIENIFKYLPLNSYIVSDIGEFMTYLFKYLPIKEGMLFHMSTGYGAMGNATGGCIGAELASPSHRTVVICGDGGFFMNGMEILTAKEYCLPIIFIVVNNAMFGLVTGAQEVLFGRTNEHAIQKRVEISKMYNAIGIPSLAIKREEDLDKIKDIINCTNGPCLIELIVDGKEKSPIMDRLLVLKKVYEK